MIPLNDPRHPFNHERTAYILMGFAALCALILMVAGLKGWH